MKRQYLGDSKDSFKWDYHHYLVSALGYDKLSIAWMLTPDDPSGHGQTEPTLFPARPEILALCQRLRSTRQPSLLTGLPATTGARYAVSLHKPDEDFSHDNRNAYFKGLPHAGVDQVLLLDPDNGFEPASRASEKHVLYSDVDGILDAVSPGSVVSVFQTQRRFRTFPDVFGEIRSRLRRGHATAVHWHSLMFVAVSLSSEAIGRVREVNRGYAGARGVVALV